MEVRGSCSNYSCCKDKNPRLNEDYREGGRLHSIIAAEMTVFLVLEVARSHDDGQRSPCETFIKFPMLKGVGLVGPTCGSVVRLVGRTFGQIAGSVVGLVDRT